MASSAHQEDVSELTRPLTPALSDFVQDPLYSKVWARPQLSQRDRSLITVAALVVLVRPELLGSHLQLALKNGVTKLELSELMTHLAFYGGFPAALSASKLALELIGPLEMADQKTS